MNETFTTSSGRTGVIYDGQDPFRRVFIAPRESQKDGSGSGTELDPYRYEWIDGRLREERTYVLAPGVYYTRGAWANPWENTWRTLPLGNIIGNGAYLLLRDWLPRKEVEWTYHLYTGSKYVPKQFIENIYLSMELSANKGLRANGGIFAHSSIDIAGCTAIATGLRRGGVKDLETFAFGSLLADESPCHWSRNTAFVENYASGFSTGVIETDDTETGICVRDCIVIGRDAHAGIIPGIGCHFDNIRVKGCRTGIFHDTDPLFDVRVVNSQFDVTYSGMTLCHQKLEHQQREVWVSGCDFRINPVDGSEGITCALLTAGGLKPEQSEFDDIRFSDCRFTSSHSKPHVLSSHGGKGQPVFSGCSFDKEYVVNGPMKPLIK